MVVATLNKERMPLQPRPHDQVEAAACPRASEAQPSPAAAPSMVRKAFEILNAFSTSDRILSIREISRRCDLPKSTAHRLVSELVEIGAIQRTEDGYRVGIGMFKLGLLSMDARYFDAAFPHLRRLHAVARRTVHLAVLQGDQSVYIDKLVGGNSPQTPALLGRGLPAWKTAVGKAMLAFRDPLGLSLGEERMSALTSTFGEPMPLGDYLRQVRGAGFAIERNETAPGVGCIAAPLFVKGTAVAAVSVVIHSREGAVPELVAPVRQTAAAISQALSVIAG